LGIFKKTERTAHGARSAVKTITFDSNRFAGLEECVTKPTLVSLEKWALLQRPENPTRQQVSAIMYLPKSNYSLVYQSEIVSRNFRMVENGSQLFLIQVKKL
jgi:hypothetical protein